MKLHLYFFLLYAPLTVPMHYAPEPIVILLAPLQIQATLEAKESNNADNALHPFSYIKNLPLITRTRISIAEEQKNNDLACARLLACAHQGCRYIFLNETQLNEHLQEYHPTRSNLIE